MSFIKVKDPKKREELIRDFIETRKRIKDNFVARKVGESDYQTGLTKLFKPITETQKATAKEITEAQKAAAEKIRGELLPIKAGIEGLPGAISFPTYPALEMTEEEEKEEIEEEIEEEKKDLGPIAKSYLVYAMRKDSDRSFGIYPDVNNKPKIGSKYLKFKGDDIIIDKTTYPGTPGLWELIVSKDPQEGIYTEEDYINYTNLLVQTNTIHQKNNPNSPKPKSSISKKWENLISPVWEHIRESKKPLPKEKGGEGGGGEEGKGKGKEKGGEGGEGEEGKGKGKGKGKKKRQEDPKPGTSGTGLKILPSDPNALIDRFDLLFSSKKAGHTGVRNEIVSILDELKRQGVININEYKKLNSLIKK